MTGLIDSGANTYAVLARVRGDGRRLIARDTAGQERLLVIVDHPPLAKRLTALFLSFEQNGSFGDLIEVFPYKSGLCAVFAYCGCTHLLEKALLHAPYDMRAAALRALFAKLLSQNMPLPLLPDILRPDNLLSLPGGDIGFLYDLHFNGGNLRPDKTGSMLRLSAIVNEISGGAALPAVDALHRRLDGNGETNWTELYAAAAEAADALAAYRPVPEPVKPPLRERAVRMRDALTERLGIIAAMVLLVMGYILLAVLFFQTVIAPKPVDNGFSEIGTVIVTHDGEE